MNARRISVLLSLTATVAAADPSPPVDEPVELKAMVLDVPRNPPPRLAGPPGPVQFPPPPLRLLESERRTTVGLQSSICANRRRPKLTARPVFAVRPSPDLFALLPDPRRRPDPRPTSP